MTGVSFVSASNGWAVGFATDVPGDVSRTLIAHWNGKSWSQVQSPNRGDLDNDLQGVSALSRADAWAVGTSAVLRNGTRCLRTLALHWNGNEWSKTPSPSPSAGLGLSI